MASTFTPNIQLNEPARNDNVGTWDTPVNSNTTLIDLVVGGIATIALNNSPIVLSAAQFQARQITFNSTLTGSVTITFPTSFTKSYSIRHLCTGSSAFVITLETTAGGQIICCPPGEAVDVVNDGTNLYYSNLGRVGGYWDYAGSSVPNWVSGCTVAPYLNCDGTTFSGTTYPTLAAMIGTTLPDSRGRARFTMNQGTSRITSTSAGGAGPDGNSLFSTGGDQLAQAHSHAVTDPGHLHTTNFQALSLLDSGSGGNTGTGGSKFETITTAPALTGISIVSALSGAGQNMPPAYVGGLTLIRAG